LTRAATCRRSKADEQFTEFVRRREPPLCARFRPEQLQQNMRVGWAYSSVIKSHAHSLAGTAKVIL
jgi:hypothetical protein